MLGIDHVVGPRVSFLSISRAPDYLQIHRLIPTSNSDVACVDKLYCKVESTSFDLSLTSSRTCRIACSYSSRQSRATQARTRMQSTAGRAISEEITWAHHTAYLSPRAQDGDGQSI